MTAVPSGKRPSFADDAFGASRTFGQAWVPLTTDCDNGAIAAIDSGE